MNTVNDTVDRTNVTSAQQAPNRVEADSLWYARLGYGGAIGPSFSNGPAFGFGYRYELDSLGIDFSFLNFMVNSGSSNNGSSVGATGSWIKLMALYFLNPQANRSTCLGGGLGWGGTAVARSSTDTMNGTINGGSAYTGSGLQAELSAGYELLRASTIRIFIQADATLPLGGEGSHIRRGLRPRHAGRGRSRNLGGPGFSSVEAAPRRAREESPTRGSFADARAAGHHQQGKEQSSAPRYAADEGRPESLADGNGGVGGPHAS